MDPSSQEEMKQWYPSDEEEAVDSLEDDDYLYRMRTTDNLITCNRKQLLLINLRTTSMQTEICHLKDEINQLKIALKEATHKKNSPKPRNDIVCFHCLNRGHFVRSCPDKKMPRILRQKQEVAVQLQFPTDVSQSLKQRASASTERKPSAQKLAALRQQFLQTPSTNKHNRNRYRRAGYWYNTAVETETNRSSNY